ncbi:hypothetical protein FIBSPDRAFT_764841 [Athelia psychrophila]|uniref:Integral membrane protein n=1 Tax=Athelia psychrophila TaxID=1759441 RepID=A0A167WJ78_9AGAM|nr:hypothetical protein FIBSPDRAFT_764841 [Fibularhizoctonia sp. CBS 109695]
MRLARLLVSLSLLQGCIAPAVSNAIAIAKYASPILDTTTSLASSNPTFDTCHDLRNCRSLVGIVTSCLATIFACVWVAVHPNVPGPKQGRTSRYFESFKLVAVTLLVPEWVLAWAVRQFLQARKYRDKLERASIYGAFAMVYNKNRPHERNTRRASSSDEEIDQPPAPHNTPSKDSTDKWTMTHGFLMTMGGFRYYRGGQPTCPLEYHEVLVLVESRSLVPPTAGELRDKSKGDALSKTIAILQTLWFVAQCIARRVENLAITNLEIVTLAYTAITVAMYAAWWHKPLNMRCPVRVKGDEEFVKNRRPFKWTHILDYVTGDHDWLITLSGEERVPTFWSSCSSRSQLPLHADIIALSVAMVFGAVHCAAWSYAFPSLEQQKMWRVCAITITAIPLPMAVYLGSFSGFLKVIFMALGALLYILARSILLVLALTTLHQLPLSAYQTVQWTTWIPHI